MPYTPRERAAQSSYVQVNPSRLTRWLVFDVDAVDAYSAAERAGIAEPDIIVMNPDNNRGHLYYRLTTPVAMTDKARRGPIAYLNAIRRRMTAALNADPSYVGLVSKNPLHSKWRVRWGSCRGYSLDQLSESLPDDIAPCGRRNGSPSGATGIGRNCDLFEVARKRAYRSFRKCRDYDSFAACVAEDCQNLNNLLEKPLPNQEVGHIAKSISGWVSERFSQKKFRKMQAFRANMRWDRVRSASCPAGEEYLEKAQSHTVPEGWAEKLKPWRKQGISRATYYRRKRQLVSESVRPRAIRRPRVPVRSQFIRISRAQVTKTPVSVTLESIYSLYRTKPGIKIHQSTA